MTALTEKEQIILQKMMERYPALHQQQERITRAFEILCESFSGGGKLLLCGNGGSAADALHIVGELMKSFRCSRPIDIHTAQMLRMRFGQDGAALAGTLENALPTISLVENVALASAVQNDISEQVSFAQQVYALGRPGDVLMCLSTSGNARNVISAARVAAAKGMSVLGLSGRNGGMLRELCDCCICVPEEETYLVQELHLPVYHALCSMLEVHFFAEG